MKITKHDRQPLVTKPKRTKPRNKGRKNRLNRVAEEYGISAHTLYQRARNYPDKTLEELAAKPVKSRAEAGKAGSKEWRKISGREYAARALARGAD